ncbi:RNA polymerase sigma factor [Pseudonocardia humida]|uniref:Sigma-70 family RNA polymerase sigma factor n=1 Tax=Pseudonocardia humida TaxID=2800819 RepID=A0ABT1A498_9PSEU|nr:sigma-70 family RNA polymerase sigma factor [Pseudonocardia humida]MCO1657589.1 sigma-70 family RNA polymerase sigma factor [Pseudonocardia humida]
MNGAESAVVTVFREEWGRIVATLIRTTGDWDLAEECAQDAVAQAVARWPRDGVPRNPGAWLTTTARNHARNRLRRAGIEAGKLRELAALPDPEAPVDEAADSGIDDDRLRLMFTCCHPALPLEGRVALTLRTLAGLTTAEIARAFLVPEATMAQRLVRAKKKIRAAAIPYRVPPAHLLPERLGGVLGVVYLLFNEGYAAATGSQAIRGDLCAEAVRLARTLARLMPTAPEALGLAALLLLQDSRRAARTDADGELVPLDEQDRSRWDREMIEEGTALLDAALVRRAPGPYQVQAAIAACHATAPTSDETDWVQIAALYARLARMVPSPVVRLNRAAAVAMAEGPAVALELVRELDGSGELAGYPLLAATRADLLSRLGRTAEAARAYRAAIDQAGTDAERRLLARRLADLGPEEP